MTKACFCGIASGQISRLAGWSGQGAHDQAKVLLQEDGDIMSSIIPAEFAWLTLKGWAIAEDVPESDYPVEKMEFVPIIVRGESKVDDETMRARAVMLQGNLGIADARSSQ